MADAGETKKPTKKKKGFGRQVLEVFLADAGFTIVIIFIQWLIGRIGGILFGNNLPFPINLIEYIGLYEEVFFFLAVFIAGLLVILKRLREEVVK